ncbi:ankyrin repeat, SAM and basic leucine zipper domain-containing protein 1 isoform X1 [Oryzias latipes]|uniref:Ankyrin repeat, SAM and basic leucine zipper domain containing 1 n=2 Tax=Oryzias latipes TaxID=8090 RepID=H2MZ30_ORYLA|nr:ankyrin repeat, SAM and basic leucine zipper domain-containing protein 1 isoform X1 [Oryzias latipes]WNT43921.1 GASZ [Oryzias latipes]
MADFTEYAFPAGAESEGSNDESDISCGVETTYLPKESGEKDHDSTFKCEDVWMMKRAISKGQTDEVIRLLDNGMDVDTKLEFGWSPLMFAVNMANHDLAKQLLDRGANANFTKDQWSVLMASCTASASEDKITRCVELLLSRNADPNVVDRSQMTSLMLAAREGYSKVINLLVAHGAKLDVQDSSGYTALAVAVKYGREKAVLKLLQLGVDKTIKTKSGKSPVDLAEFFKHPQIAKILNSSSQIDNVGAFGSTEESLSRFFKTNCETPPTKESVTRLNDLELLLHGLNLSHLTEVMTENDITWSCLLTMKREDLEKIGITDPEDQEKVLNVVQQIHLDKIDLNTLCQLRVVYNGCEDLQNFLISVNHQCCYLIEVIHDVVSRFPRQTSQLVFSLDSGKEAQSTCRQLVLQIKDLEKEVSCLHSLLCKMDETRDCCWVPPPPRSPKGWKKSLLTRVVVSVLAAASLLLFYKAARGKVQLHLFSKIL